MAPGLGADAQLTLFIRRYATTLVGVPTYSRLMWLDCSVPSSTVRRRTSGHRRTDIRQLGKTGRVTRLGKPSPSGTDTVYT